MVGVLLLSAASPALAFEHTAGIRYRHGYLPSGILDVWYHDSDVAGALPLDRPKVSTDVFGLEYTLAIEPGGGPSFLFWLERMPFHMDSGYWDDVESPPDFEDGDWLQPEKGLGMWTLGANYLHQVPLSDSSKPVWAALHVGGGIGLGFVSGSVSRWHPGFHEDSLDPTCLPSSLAPERYATCNPDSELDLPGVLPVVDLTIGPMVHLTENAMVRLDLGLHDVPYFGFAGGGCF